MSVHPWPRRRPEVKRRAAAGRFTLGRAMSHEEVLRLIKRLAPRECRRLVARLQEEGALRPYAVIFSLDAWATCEEIVLKLLDQVVSRGRCAEARRAKREERDRYIGMALANGLTDPEDVFRFIQQADPSLVKDGKQPIDARRMMSEHRRRHRPK
jgi:hypothetical protein